MHGVVVAPGVEDDDGEPRLPSRLEVASGDAPEVMRDAGAKQRALADACLAVEHGQARRHQVRLDELALALPTEEEGHVAVRVLERGQPLVGRERTECHACTSAASRLPSRAM